MSMNQRVRSATCSAVSLLQRKKKRKALRGFEGDLGAITTERAPRDTAHACLWKHLKVGLGSSVNGLRIGATGSPNQHKAFTPGPGESCCSGTTCKYFLQEIALGTNLGII
jgi:hypothetical protein